MRTTLILALLVLLTAVAGAGKLKQVRYIGIHPIPKAEGGGFCNIEGPHVHVFGANKLEYRDHHGANYFVGDPVAYGYDGPKTAYKGHHPIHVEAVVGEPEPDVVYCYINGPHYHYFAPPAGPDFQVAGDAYFYVGTPPPVYVQARPAMMEINAIYTPIVYARPVVEIDAPVGWIGARAEFAVVAPAVVVEPPHAHVVTPGVDVHVGVGVVVPPPPRIEVGIGVGVGVGGGVIVGGHRDNGLHRGEYKHKKFKGKRRHW